MLVLGREEGQALILVGRAEIEVANIERRTQIAQIRTIVGSERRLLFLGPSCSVQLADDITLHTVLFRQFRGEVHLGIDAPKDVVIVRREIMTNDFRAEHELGMTRGSHPIALSI